MIQSVFYVLSKVFDLLLPVDHRYGPRDGGWLPRVESLERSSAVLRELAGRLVYRVAGYAGS